MKNAIIVVLLAGIVLLVVLYLLRAKKRGEKCIGCPCCKQCGGHCDHEIKDNSQNDN